jgi:hypothetical protein
VSDYDDYPVGLSIEEIEDRLVDHPCRNHPVGEVPCPCHERDPLAGCIALVCADCNEPVLVVVSPHYPLCTHARSLLPPRVRPLRRHGMRRRRRRRP